MVSSYCHILCVRHGVPVLSVGSSGVHIERFFFFTKSSGRVTQRKINHAYNLLRCDSL
jgi:hypothetical protein